MFTWFHLILFKRNRKRKSAHVDQSRSRRTKKTFAEKPGRVFEISKTIFDARFRHRSPVHKIVYFSPIFFSFCVENYFRADLEFEEENFGGRSARCKPCCRTNETFSRQTRQKTWTFVPYRKRNWSGLAQLRCDRATSRLDKIHLTKNWVQKKGRMKKENLRNFRKLIWTRIAVLNITEHRANQEWFRRDR